MKKIILFLTPLIISTKLLACGGCVDSGTSRATATALTAAFSALDKATAKAIKSISDIENQNIALNSAYANNKTSITNLQENNLVILSQLNEKLERRKNAKTIIK